MTEPTSQEAKEQDRLCAEDKHLSADGKLLALKQYDSLRKEIENAIQQISTLDLSGALATGAVLTAMISLQDATSKIHPPILLGSIT